MIISIYRPISNYLECCCYGGGIGRWTRLGWWLLHSNSPKIISIRFNSCQKIDSNQISSACMSTLYCWVMKSGEGRGTNWCHIIVVTVDFQTTFEDVLVCGLVLMALLTLFLSLSTEHVVFLCVLRVLAVFWTKRHANLFVNNNNNKLWSNRTFRFFGKPNRFDY